MSTDDLIAQVDRLTTANLELHRKTRDAQKNLHDWFMGQALTGAAAFDPGEAQEIVRKAKRIADAAMRERRT